MNGTPKSNAAFSPLRQGWPVVGIAGAIAIGNMVMSILCQQNNSLALLAVPWYGTLVAQMGLLCTWCVFANIAGWRRVVGTLGLSALIFGPLVIGYVVAFRDRELPTLLRISAGFVLLILIITTTTQLPLWILKIFFGWRIGNGRNRSSAPLLAVFFAVNSAVGIEFVPISPGTKPLDMVPGRQMSH